MNQPTDLVCPKCQGTMRSYERNGITIDQCQECRGVFLDRGELDLLIDAEQRRSQGPTDLDEWRRSSSRSESGHHGSGSAYDGKDQRKRSRGGFFSEMFD